MKLKRFLKAGLKTQIFYLYDLARKNPNLNNGFIEEKVKQLVERGDYFLGAGDVDVLTDGQWDRYSSKGELQRRNDRDKMACVTFSGHNGLEEIINFYISQEKNQLATQEQIDILNVFRAFGLIKDGECNVSDRYTAKMSGTSIRGNSQQIVANSIRHNGLVAEDKWPYVNDWDEYYKPILPEIIKLGRQFVEYIDITYKWEYPVYFDKANKRSPVQTSVCADSRWNNGGIIPRNDGQKNHAVVNDGFVMYQYRKIADSYEPFKKQTAWNFSLGMGMIFFITLKKKFSNQGEIDKLQKSHPGLRYVQDVEGSGAIYELTSTGLRHYSPSELNNDYVRDLEAKKILVGVSQEIMMKLKN